MDQRDEYRLWLKRFENKAGVSLLDTVIAKGLSTGYFVETDDDLYDIFVNVPDEFRLLYNKMLKAAGGSGKRTLSDMRVELALRLSLTNTLFSKQKLSTSETYISDFVFEQDKIAKALVEFDNQKAQNPLAFLIDPENTHRYYSIIKGQNIHQVGTTVSNGFNKFKMNRMFITHERIDVGLIEEVNLAAYHPIVWHLICEGTLLEYSHLFPKVKEYVEKLEALSKDG